MKSLCVIVINISFFNNLRIDNLVLSVKAEKGKFRAKRILQSALIIQPLIPLSDVLERIDMTMLLS